MKLLVPFLLLLVGCQASVNCMELSVDDCQQDVCKLECGDEGYGCAPICHPKECIDYSTEGCPAHCTVDGALCV